ncbi:helix-turn-helix domain-containing protein [Arthrobacter monumenti]
MSAQPSRSDREEAARAWAALAAELSGQHRMRLSKDGGKNYPTGHERALTRALPSVPAAVRIVATGGLVRSLCLDLDVGRDGLGQVEADYEAIKRLLARLGGRWVEDRSPGGGRHIYVPFIDSLAFTDARHLVEALGRRFSSLDPSPHQSAETGCIRPPGSLWKRGGYQSLTMPLSEAYDVAKRRNGYSVRQGLQKDLAEELAIVTQHRRPSLTVVEDDVEQLPLPAGTKRALPADKQSMARSGAYDIARYASASEARQAIMASAVACGWELTDILRHMQQNSWPGMTAFYARYRPHSRAKELRNDWREAVRYVTAQRKRASPLAAGNNNDRKRDTSRLNTQGGGGTVLTEHQFLRGWRTTLGSYEQTFLGTRAGLGYRMLLRALGEGAHKAESRFIEFGTRSLSLGTGTHASTVARQLRELATMANPMIRLAQEAKGTHGDLYELVIPAAYQRDQESREWAKGKLHALRPVFYELGIPAAFVYEAIEQGDGRWRSADLARQTGLSPSTVNMALETMCAWNMIERRNGVWSIVPTTSLRTLAEYFGVLDHIAGCLQRHRQERANWRDWLAKRAFYGSIIASPDDDYPYWDSDGPPERETTMPDLLNWPTAVIA